MKLYRDGHIARLSFDAREDFYIDLNPYYWAVGFYVWPFSYWEVHLGPIHLKCQIGRGRAKR